MDSIPQIAFIGEQLLSFLDELGRVPCPRCMEPKLSATFTGGAVLVRCSADLNDLMYEYEGEIAERICDFKHLIQRVSLSEGPFILKFSEDKRATKKNSTRKRSTTTRRSTRKAR